MSDFRAQQRGWSAAERGAELGLLEPVGVGGVVDRMAKMNLPLIEQLELIKQRCEEIEEKYPQRRAAYKPSFTNFDTELRRGIVSYHSGWGWRLRKNWRKTWQQKHDELSAETIQ